MFHKFLGSSKPDSFSNDAPTKAAHPSSDRRRREVAPPLGNYAATPSSQKRLSPRRTFDKAKYCLYLYVSDSNKLCSALNDAKNSSWCRNWGGLHCTLCSFASSHATYGARFKHGSNLNDCMNSMMKAAASAARSHRISKWRCSPEAVGGWGLDGSGKAIVSINYAKDPILAAMAAEHAKFNLSRGEEKMQGLHLTLGPLSAMEKQMTKLIGKSEIDKLKTGSCQVPRPLVQEICQIQWELLIVKDAKGVSPHTVTDKEDSVVLVF